jgi:molecular chaperone GrpE
MTDTKNSKTPENDAEKGEESKKPREAKMINITDIELETLKNELRECQDKYVRYLAESENARKRMAKEKHELIQYALQNLIVDFLDPIDHFENALKFTHLMSDEVKNWALGFQMILGQFKDVLSNNSVEAFASVGTQFDPHLHEAVEVVNTNEHPPGTVVEENLRGFKMGDRIIRPARVKVAKPVEEKKPKEEEESI